MESTIEFILSIISGVFIPFAFGVFLKINRDNKCFKRMNMHLARSQMMQIYKDAKARGYTTLEEAEQFWDLNKDYSNLGGNGFLEVISNKFEKFEEREHL